MLSNLKQEQSRHCKSGYNSTSVFSARNKLDKRKKTAYNESMPKIFPELINYDVGK